MDRKEQFCFNCGRELSPGPGLRQCLRCGVKQDLVELDLVYKFFEKEKKFVTSVVISPIFEGVDETSRFYQGLELLQKMKLKEALDYYESQISLNPKTLELWNNLGVVYMGLSNRLNAIKSYKKAILLDPNYYVGYYNIGGALLLCGQFEKAIKFFDMVLKINPTCAEAYWDRSIAKENLGHNEFGKAEKAWEQGLNIFRAQRNISKTLVDLGNEEDATSGFSLLVLKDVDKIRKYKDQAIELIENGKDDQKALSLLNKCIEINPKSASVWSLKARVLNLLNKNEEALQCINKAIGFDPNIEYAWELKMIILAFLNRNDEGYKCSKRLFQLNPYNSFVAEVVLEPPPGLNNLIKDNNKLCKHCGTKNEKEFKFCIDCGSEDFY